MRLYKHLKRIYDQSQPPRLMEIGSASSPPPRSNHSAGPGPSFHVYDAALRQLPNVTAERDRYHRALEEIAACADESANLKYIAEEALQRESGPNP